MFEDLKPEETELVGMWLDLGLKITGDAIADRVEWLAANRLQKLAEKPDEGAELYRDPRDNRLWEKVLAFAGGPPTLRVITQADAATRFGYTG
ncbi:hypothetical protein Geob_1147 [Geotalea daltonii FRC-32]|uniref:Uncharacterized protein n=1 Tax=Geotalea daltonii (strain DSM 22248 / JCM 15807 / FRC-32) TaxID=316067 RepID=B9M397_GEODF|nr:Imm27 family immunity protein [Geotalea daltonii]ACM19507.1 hypothetical protein Geob_1147 [Geotalea daltonii FRC-32]